MPGFALCGDEEGGDVHGAAYIAFRVVYAVLNVTAFVLLNLRIQLSPPSELTIIRAVLRSAWLATLLSCGVLYDPLGLSDGGMAKVVSNVANGCILSGVIFHVGGCQMTSEVRHDRGAGKVAEAALLSFLLFGLWLLVLVLLAGHAIWDCPTLERVEAYGYASVGSACALMYAAAMRHNISVARAATKSFQNPMDVEFRTLSRRRARKLVRQVVGVLSLMVGGVAYLMYRQQQGQGSNRPSGNSLLALLSRHRFVFVFVKLLFCYMWLYVYGVRPKTRSADTEDEDAALLLKRMDSELDGQGDADEDSEDEGRDAVVPSDSRITTSESESGRGLRASANAGWAVQRPSHGGVGGD